LTAKRRIVSDEALAVNQHAFGRLVVLAAALRATVLSDGPKEQHWPHGRRVAVFEAALRAALIDDKFRRPRPWPET